MTIQEIYDKFTINPGLREHMIRVAQFSNAVLRIWDGPYVDAELLTKCAMVHDLGNIVVFKRWFGEETNNLRYWQQIQQNIIAKYGTDDHQVTKKMLQEIGAGSKIIDPILHKSSSKSPVIAASDDWFLKIFLYSDLRITPTGVASLAGKLKEMYARSDKHKNLTGIQVALEEIEQQLQVYATRDLKSISEGDFTLDKVRLLAINL
jgi:hypothetical protein